MKHTTEPVNHAALPQGNPKPLDPLFRAIFDGRGGDRRSNHAFDSVADGLATYGRATHAQWDFDRSEAGRQGSRPISKAERQDKRQNGSWVRDFIPATRKPCDQVVQVNVHRVAGSLCDTAVKRMRIEVRDRVTGEETEIVAKLQTNTIYVSCYGKIVEFSMTNRAKGTFCDGRDGKRKPISFAKSELCRMLGHSEGMARFAELCQFDPPKCATLSPSSTSSVQPSDTRSGHTDAGQQAHTSHS